ncbi:apidermin 2 isoform X2 [Xylocopa sonorina]|uniref:apidermin 2 isoform X2 n=1 Tax=Xylocopa sonorina TaxID=1818115 RepID=UPI00403B3330
MLGFSSVAYDFEFSKKLKQHNKPNKMKYLLILFAIVALAAAFPEQERERRGILAAPALATPWIAAPKIAAPAVAIAAAPKLLAAPVVAAPALAPAWGLKGW